MTILIFILICFLIAHIIHHFTVIEQLNVIKRNQHDILDALEYWEDDEHFNED
jgi:hypothetical protein